MHKRINIHNAHTTQCLYKKKGFRDVKYFKNPYVPYFRLNFDRYINKLSQLLAVLQIIYIDNAPEILHIHRKIGKYIRFL